VQIRSGAVDMEVDTADTGRGAKAEAVAGLDVASKKSGDGNPAKMDGDVAHREEEALRRGLPAGKSADGAVRLAAEAVESGRDPEAMVNISKIHLDWARQFAGSNTVQVALTQALGVTEEDARLVVLEILGNILGASRQNKSGAFRLAKDLQDGSPAMVVVDPDTGENFQAAHVRLRDIILANDRKLGPGITWARGFFEALRDNFYQKVGQVPQGKVDVSSEAGRLFLTFMVREFVLLEVGIDEFDRLRGNGVLEEQAYDQAVAKAEAVAEAFEKAIVGDRLDQFLQEKMREWVAARAQRLAQAQRELDAQAGNSYWDGDLKTTPVTRPFRASQREDLVDISELPEAEAARLERIGAEALLSGEGHISMLAAGASSRMNVHEAPADVRAMVEGKAIESKAGVPIGVVDGVVITYLDAFGENVGRLLRDVDAEAQRAGRESHAMETTVGLLSNDAYRAEHDEILRRNDYYGLDPQQVRFFHQPLGAKFVGTPADVEALYRAGKFASEEQYQRALAHSRDVERRRAEDPSAVVLEGERDPLGHGEYFHQLIASGELLELIRLGKKWVYIKNVDNYAAKFDKAWLRLLGLFIDKGLDFQPEVSPRAPGQKGGTLVIMTDEAGGHQIIEDPIMVATQKAGLTKMSPNDPYWLNNAVAFHTIDYVIDIYRNPGQTREDFITELNAADEAGRQAIAERGRRKFPQLIDPKPAKAQDAVAVKVETNMWTSTGVVDQNEAKVEAVGVRGARNFAINNYIANMTPAQKTVALEALRFLATKQWDVAPAAVAKIRADLATAMGRQPTDEELALTLESFAGNELLANDLLNYILHAELVTPGILGENSTPASRGGGQSEIGGDEAMLVGSEDVNLTVVPSAVPARRILVVEDSPMVRETMDIVLRLEGYDVTMANDGVEALEILAAGGQFDLLTSDVDMPRMDGPALVERLAKSHPNLPVLFHAASPVPDSTRALPNVRGVILKGDDIVDPVNAEFARMTQASPVGGINLDPKLLDLQIKRDSEGIPLPLNLQPLDQIHIEGIVPVIINVTPVTNLPDLLGFVPPSDRKDKKENARLSWMISREEG
ncbi:MAG: UTP--glucose-1-phosphate uridylyltransferase, partial [Candidatus Omnitrophica bacterium]|nr:UTP--glucose-1-phosphate uridylyltransferase [Candidatus Omnitrophota bacterium]